MNIGLRRQTKQGNVRSQASSPWKGSGPLLSSEVLCTEYLQDFWPKLLPLKLILSSKVTQNPVCFLEPSLSDKKFTLKWDFPHENLYLSCTLISKQSLRVKEAAWHQKHVSLDIVIFLSKIKNDVDNDFVTISVKILTEKSLKYGKCAVSEMAKGY